MNFRKTYDARIYRLFQRHIRIVFLLMTLFYLLISVSIFFVFMYVLFDDVLNLSAKQSAATGDIWGYLVLLGMLLLGLFSTLMTYRGYKYLGKQDVEGQEKALNFDKSGNEE